MRSPQLIIVLNFLRRAASGRLAALVGMGMAALLADCGGGGGSDSMYADAQAALRNQIAARHANVPAMLH